MYKKFKGSHFQFEHCWLLSRNEPKQLQFKPKEKHKRSNSLPQTTQTPDSDQAFGDKVSHDSFVDLERPIGRKAEKAKRKRKDNEKEDVVVFMERKTKFLEDACEVEKELIRMKGEKIRLEELRMKEKINLEKKIFLLNNQERMEECILKRKDAYRT